ncbi:unnamed protein product [Coregonus sp. 'balchen']|nr:unnamed protein product [Coregonus sp. 'balchen']
MRTCVLRSTWTAASLLGQPDPGLECAPERADLQSDPAPAQSVSVETEYLSAWTVSQALLLRGKLRTQPETSPVKAGFPQIPPLPTPSTSTTTSSPELYSPATPTQSPRETGQGGTQQGSMELFYEPLLSQRQEEGGVILETTADGVLCSQVAKKVKSPTPQPERKGHQTTGKGCVTSQSPTTLLARCGTQGVRYSILVAVVQPVIHMASVVVTEQSGVEIKVVLWRRAAFWALTVYPGDGSVVLWGAALTWLQCICINRNKGKVRTNALWEFRVLLVRESMTSGLLELYSTPWGSCEPSFLTTSRRWSSTGQVLPNIAAPA